jgi:ubiquinone/menaquinone biosynthesis C-methylase UbiE
MSHWEYKDRNYWERTYSLEEAYLSDKAITEGNDGEQEFDIKMLNAADAKAILDVGCGDGLFTIQIAQSAKKVVGVDFSTIAIAEAEKNLSQTRVNNARFELADAGDLPFPRETFDLVTSRRGPVTDSKTSLSEGFRVLRKGGTLMEITIGEHDKENLARIFGRGQMLGSEKVSVLKQKSLREIGFRPLKIKEYIATEIFPAMNDLIIRLKNSPIIPDFDPDHDKEYLEKVEKVCRTSRGIKTQTHRVTIIARK